MLQSLDPHSKHKIIYSTLNFHTPCPPPPPPPYKRKVWDYKTAKTNSIRKDLSNINWQTLFLNRNVNEMSLVFADTFLSILSQHISNKIITCNDKDAPWITPKVKSAIRRNSRVYHKWVKRGKKHDDHDKVREVHNSTNHL